VEFIIMNIVRIAALTATILALANAAQSATLSYTAVLSGAAESPPNLSMGMGSAIVDYDDAIHTLRIRFDFSDLSGTLTAAHIHGPTATPGTGVVGVITATPTLPGTPVGVASGSLDVLFSLVDAASFNPAFVTSQGSIAAAEAALAASLAGGRAYLNLHSTTFAGGEIRGFLTPAPVSAVPLPASLPLMVAAFGMVGLIRRRLTASGERQQTNSSRMILPSAS
jgi:hypothetical protein